MLRAERTRNVTGRQSGEVLTLPVVWAGSGELPIAATGNSAPIPQDDCEPVARLQTQEISELDLLFVRYSRLVFGTACRVLGDPSEAEEVVQDVFFYLYRKSELFNPSKGSLKAWIIQITLCRALDRKLYLARRGFYMGEDIDSLQLREQADLEQHVQAKLSRKYLETAFAELTEMQRRTIEFFYFEDLNLREISKLLSKPLGTVRHNLYRGLERLRKSSHLHSLFVNML
jgi:RNA polymerase sigma-70 factor (ECF subfamily)